ncbi:hypothetical protein P781_18265 [Vibrio mimicus CAIM 1883]|nr:hypothetical protein D908_13753 [Vibrio mimicus CAIM 602]ERM52829.1 hypothetical protein P780_18335 [Vibrio mimicus CAIM 1882]ERM53036.1 hypothetical protein P781_18265 [Vibrio mimicus CAIM 1883]
MLTGWNFKQTAATVRQGGYEVNPEGEPEKVR